MRSSFQTRRRIPSLTPPLDRFDFGGERPLGRAIARAFLGAIGGMGVPQRGPSSTVEVTFSKACRLPSNRRGSVEATVDLNDFNGL